jgi:hypothetical protein
LAGGEFLLRILSKKLFQSLPYLKSTRLRGELQEGYRRVREE